MNRKQILGLVRHVATFAGGVLVALGYSDQATADQIGGVALTIAGIVFSFLDKKDA